MLSICTKILWNWVGEDDKIEYEKRDGKCEKRKETGKGGTLKCLNSNPTGCGARK